jgi:hypothetical protein
MSYKKNFRVLVIGHLVGLIVTGILFFTSAGDGYFIKSFFAAVMISFIIQILIYIIKPTLFNNKSIKHPDQR